MENRHKDPWDKASIVLQPVGGLLTAIAVAVVGYVGATVLDRQQASDSNIRLYSELISKREEAETDLRKAMFVSIIESFLKPEATKPESRSLESRLVSLELLAYNFHESLELKPLFLHLRREITSTLPAGADYLRRLEHLARDVTAKQMLVLEDGGAKFDAHIDLDQLRGYLRDHPGGGLELPNRALTLDSVVRNFRIILLGENRARRELRVQLETQTLEHAPDEPESLDSRPFTVGFFDFPMIDNTRLSRDQRCAIVINALDDHNADISLVYFHGSRASLREKPYYEEVVQRLVGSTAPGITSGYHRR